eukprot:TRINITY_DN28707_c0_g1_i1.p1 TRINITY_DN28707_c0_g1~~TRINITY_DN28707_c0_g1_i1.p1  ORF type:complete len:346 (+),score=46.98 TRINITY_DN28707_c0_g1_i1:104-1141(+)
MIWRPPRSTLSSSSAASDVYKRQVHGSSQNSSSSQLYFSPEEVEFNNQQNKLKFSSNLYSLGMIMLELFQGNKATIALHEAKLQNSKKLYNQVLNNLLPTKGSKANEILFFSSILKNMLQFSPQSRMTAGEIVSKLLDEKLLNLNQVQVDTVQATLFMMIPQKKNNKTQIYFSNTIQFLQNILRYVLLPLLLLKSKLSILAKIFKPKITIIFILIALIVVFFNQQNQQLNNEQIITKMTQLNKNLDQQDQRIFIEKNFNQISSLSYIYNQMDSKILTNKEMKLSVFSLFSNPYINSIKKLLPDNQNQKITNNIFHQFCDFKAQTLILATCIEHPQTIFGGFAFPQ